MCCMNQTPTTIPRVAVRGGALVLWIVGLGLWLLGKRWLAMSKRVATPIDEFVTVYGMDQILSLKRPTKT